MAKVFEQDLERSSIASFPSSSLANDSAISQSSASTKPTSRSSSLNIKGSKGPDQSMPRKSLLNATEATETSSPQNGLIPDSDDFEEHSSPRVATSPEFARGTTRRKSARRTSRFVEEDPGVGVTTNSASDGGLTSDSHASNQHLPDGVLAGEISRSKSDLLENGIDALDMDWNLGSPSKRESQVKRHTTEHEGISRRKSSRFSAMGEMAKDAASALGKRGRDAVDSGMDKIRAIQRKKNARQRLTEGERLLLEEHTKKQEMDQHRHNTTLHLRPGKNPRDLPKLPKGWSYNIPEEEMPAAKRAKIDDENKKNNRVADSEDEYEEQKKERKPKDSGTQQPRRKKWLKQGLYAGQKRGFDPRLKPTQNVKKLAKKNLEENKENGLLPLPMFAGETLLERGRNFKLPFDVFCPLPAGQPKPEEWKKIRSNRFFGDAQQYWAKQQTLPHSWCECHKTDGCCGDNCINRALSYECDSSNCNVDPTICTNRAFADLKDRYKKGTKFEIGVEVMMTKEKGFGVRACRTFDDEQIILEYAGEIITEDECQRRMKEDYKDAKSFYLMEFDQGMIIDATRGSMARFVNHSCQPNCEMRKWIVDKKPRMALFALRDIMTGEELTYDYNFEPTGQPQPCHCGAENCRGVIGPRTSKDKEKQRSKEQQEKKEEKAKKIVIEKKKQLDPARPPPKTASLQTNETKTSSARSIVSNAIAGTKRKFKEIWSTSSSKDDEASEIAKQQANDRRARLQKRRRVSPETASHLDHSVTLRASQSGDVSEEDRKPLVPNKSQQTETKQKDEKRVASTSTGETTLFNPSMSSLDESAHVKNFPSLSADGLTETRVPKKPSGSKLYAECKVYDIPVESVNSATEERQRLLDGLESTHAISKSVEEPKSFFDPPSSSSTENQGPSPEHRGSSNPWMGQGSSRYHAKKAESVSKSKGQSTLEGFVRRSSTVKRVTEVFKKDNKYVEIAEMGDGEQEARKAQEIKRSKSVRVVDEKGTA